MNVCLISEEYPPETGWGGIGTYTYNLANGLSALGHRVHVIARTWEREQVHDHGGVAVHRVAMPEPSWRRGTYHLNLAFPESREVLQWNLAVRKTIDSICRDEPLDLAEVPEFHAQGLLSIGLCRNMRWVVKLHTPAYLCRAINGTSPGGSRFDTVLTERAEQGLTAAADLITSPSKCLARDVSSHWKIGLDRIRVIANPIDDSTFCPGSSRPVDDRCLLFVGRLERRKGVETLAEAFLTVHRRMPDVRIRFVGNDHGSGPGGMSMKTHLTNRFKEAGVPDNNLEFSGPMPRNDLPSVYRAAAICVAPSLYENFPYTCLEAMSCGCTVVASHTGGIPEMITDGHDGILVPPGDSTALADVLTRLLACPQRRAELARGARQTVAGRFSRQAISAATAAVYQQVL